MTLTEYTELIEEFYARIYFTRKRSIWWKYVFTDTRNSKSNPDRALGSCDRASWVKYEERKTNKMQQLEVYY